MKGGEGKITLRYFKSEHIQEGSKSKYRE